MMGSKLNNDKTDDPIFLSERIEERFHFRQPSITVQVFDIVRLVDSVQIHSTKIHKH